MRFQFRPIIYAGMFLALMPLSPDIRISAQPVPPPPSSESQENQPQIPPERIPLPPQRVTTRPAVAQRQLFRTAFGTSPFSASRQRLTRAPDMFGDMLLPGPGFVLTEPCQLVDDEFPCPDEVTNLSLIQPGGGGFKISDNGEVLPVDRVFVNYNHFHNALALQGPTSFNSGNYDRTTLGVEKTFANGAHSIEMRLPFSGGINTTLSRPNLAPLGVSGGDLGNLTLVFKSLMYQDNNTAFGGGLALEIPTGDDLFLRTPNEGTFEFENQAFHLHPYLGLLHMTEDDVFFSSYLQFDAGLNDNPLYRTLDSRQRLGDAAPLSLIMLDVGVGKWIYRNLAKDGITGIAPLVELHYLSTIDGIDGFGNGNSGSLRTTRTSFQTLNLTAGTHVELNGFSALRVAAVTPLLGQNFRTFDAEIQVQYTIHY